MKRLRKSVKTLNIKDPEAHRLAAAIARERYERLPARRGKASFEELLGIAKRISSQVRRPYIDHADLLYDKHALPN